MLMATVKDALGILGYGRSETVASEIFVIVSEKGERERETRQGRAGKRLCQIECFGMHMILCFVIHVCIKAQANFLNKYLGGCRL
jgi:hypothetical protein